MSNIERAAEVLSPWVSNEWAPPDPRIEAAEALAAEGLLVTDEQQRSERNKLAEAFIVGLQVGADEPVLAGDGDAMYQAFRDWADAV